MDSIDLSADTHCRACLRQPQGQMYSLSSKGISINGISRVHGELVNLAKIYNECTQLVYEEMNPNWEWICQSCCGKLTEFFKFQKMCIESYEKLKDIELQKLKNSEVDIVKVEVIDIANILESNENKNFDHELFEEESSGDGIYFDTEIRQNEETPKIQTIETNGTIAGEDKESDDSSSDDDLPLNELNMKKQLKLPNRSRTVKKSVSTKKSTPVEKIFTCDICPAKFFTNHHYDGHMRKHRGLKAYKCNLCEKELDKYCNLKKHIASKHEGKRTEFKCDFEGCGKTYTEKQHVKMHFNKVHLGIKPNLPKTADKICEHCGKCFKSNTSLIEHSFIHTRQSLHKCYICNKMLRSKDKLKIHIMKHEDIKNFVCTVCGMRKATNNELQSHMKYHNPDIQYPCELCSKIFKNPWNMKRHVDLVHHGVKNFHCKYCSQSFGKAETLKHHEMTHTGEKPHVCSVCDKKFIQVVALKRHLQTHNKTKTS